MIAGARQSIRIFPHEIFFLGFTENNPKKKKYPVSCSSLGENALLMLEVRGE